jgi:hypothetical protein
MMVAMGNRPLRRAAAAEYLRDRFGIPSSLGTLANQAVHGTGPPYCLVAGKVAIYSEDDLTAWAVERISRPIRKASDVATGSRNDQSD